MEQYNRIVSIRYKGVFDHPYNHSINDKIISNYTFSMVFDCPNFAIKDLFYSNIFKNWHNLDFELLCPKCDDFIMNKFGSARDLIATKFPFIRNWNTYNLPLYDMKFGI